MGEQDHRAAGGQASRHIADAKEMDIAEEADAAKKPRVMDSPAPSTLTMARQDTALRGAPARCRSRFRAL